MAYWIQETSNNHNMSNYRLFHCDYLSDIDKLPKYGIEGVPQDNDTVSHKPCAYGSECICHENGSKWSLGKASNTWNNIGIASSGSGGGSSSGGGISEDNIATGEDVKNTLDGVFNNKK